MKLCKRCNDPYHCTECDDLIGYISFGMRQIANETGVDKVAFLEAMSDWVDKEIRKHNEEVKKRRDKEWQK